MAKHKYIETPEKLYELFTQYKKYVKSKPFLVKDWVGKDGIMVKREKEKPLTMEGFECYLFDNNIIADIGHYLSNRNNEYAEYVTICSHIKKEIREDQIAGGMAGIYNPSITQRLNNLVEKVEQTNIEQPLFPDVSKDNSDK